MPPFATIYFPSMVPASFVFFALVLASDAVLGNGFAPDRTEIVADWESSPPRNPSSNLLKPRVFSGNGATLRRSQKLESGLVVLRGNSTILSQNRTFELGFFHTGGESSWYLGIWYASIPTPTYVWVANRVRPVKNLASATLEITGNGRLAVVESGNEILWQSTNTEMGSAVDFSDSGNLALLSSSEKEKPVVVWQSFDHPTDTWLPGMRITNQQPFVSWRSLSDPSIGFYSLRIKPPQYGEFELVYNGSGGYWSTGNWTGEAFSGVPEMTIPYIYTFNFSDPFTPAASFWYTERSLDSGVPPPLTRFRVESDGLLRQYTWSPQTEYWNMFWSQPENPCRVTGLCGNLGFCNSKALKPCVCLSGFVPVDVNGWNFGDYSGGCRRQSGGACDGDDGFEEVDTVSYDVGYSVPLTGSRSMCENSCLSNCSCIGLFHNEKTNLCKNLYGSLLNLRNLTSDATYDNVLFLRVPRGGIAKKNKLNGIVVIASVVGSALVLGLLVLVLLILRNRMRRRKREEEDGNFPVLNMKVFSYKELNAATRGFSEKLGHGGFGAVFQGELPDSTIVAVKRLERPGSGEKEFRAEVCTIGNIQHVNLVRLRGFCSENSHRLLVYDYMPNGPLSMYLRQDGPNMSWDVRFRVAIGTARGIAYLHEECRYCIIHCDIKPENILLDSEFTAKVSDFGLAKLLGRDFSRVLATMRGTWGYVAPEWISGLEITAKADVYSYGMTLLELIGGRRNVEAPSSAVGANTGREGAMGEKWFFPPWAARHIIEGNVATVMDNRLGSAYSIEEAERVALVAVWCIQDDEEVRPTMRMVVKMLEGVVEVTIPPPPKLLQALVSGDSFRGIEAKSGSGSGYSAHNGASQASLGNVSSPIHEINKSVGATDDQD